jgi:hypothetical protein
VLLGPLAWCVLCSRLRQLPPGRVALLPPPLRKVTGYLCNRVSRCCCCPPMFKRVMRDAAVSLADVRCRWLTVCGAPPRTRRLKTRCRRWLREEAWRLVCRPGMVCSRRTVLSVALEAAASALLPAPLSACGCQHVCVAIGAAAACRCFPGRKFSPRAAHLPPKSRTRIAAAIDKMRTSSPCIQNVHCFSRHCGL